jgi:glycosyltransferase involved in cell wall biosynthesis
VRRLKILFLTAWYPTREKPGWGVFVREHAKAAQLYDDVVVLHCPIPGPSGTRISLLERETDASLSEGLTTYRIWTRSRLHERASELLHVWNIWRAFRQVVGDGFRPDILHAHTYLAACPAAMVAKVHGLPLVVTEHSSAFPRRVLRPRDVRRAQQAFRAAKWVLPVSLALQRGIEAYGITAHFQVVPNAVDISLFSPLGEARPAKRLQYRLLWVGALIPLKGLDHLFEALAQLREQRTDWRLDVVGDGPQRAEYERLATELGLDADITFHGHRAKSEIAELMRQADLFVLSSQLETFSVVCIEAMASGLPVLATRCGGPEELISPDVGRLVPPNDPDALAQGLGEMLDNLTEFAPNQLARYADERFGHNRVGAQLDEIYAACVPGRRSLMAGC